MSVETSASETDDELPMRSAVIQKSGGSLRVTIPADVAEALDLGGGDAVFVRAEGDDEFAVRATTSVQWRSD